MDGVKIQNLSKPIIAEKKDHVREQGKENHFSELYRKNVSPVFYYLYSRVGNAADAEDLTSQTFITALENLAKLRDPQKFTPWVFTIARNKASDYFRKKLSRPLEEFNDEIGLTVENRALTQVDHDRLQDLETLISNLNEVEQEYLRLRIVANLPFAEIASILRKPEGSVKKKYYRLLERLKAQVER